MAPQLRSPTAAACADARFLCGVFRRPADSAQRALGGVLRAGQPRVRSRVGCIAARARCTELHQRFEQGACCGAPRRQRAVLPSSPPSSCSPRSSAPAASCHGDLSFSHLVVRRNRHSTTCGASRAARTVKGRGGGAQCWARAATRSCCRAAPSCGGAAPGAGHQVSQSRRWTLDTTNSWPSAFGSRSQMVRFVVLESMPVSVLRCA